MSVRSSFVRSFVYLSWILFAGIAGAATEREQCLVELWGSTDMPPAEIGARPSALREFLTQIEALRTQLLKHRKPEDEVLIVRVDGWIKGLRGRIAAAKNDDSLPGVAVIGFSEFDSGAVLGGDQTAFERVASAIARDPKVPASSDTLAVPRARLAVTNDLTLLVSRSGLEDQALNRRAQRWLAAFDIANKNVSSAAPPKPPPARTDIEEFFEVARESTIKSVHAAVTASKLGPTFKRSPARQLSEREQLLYAVDYPGLREVIAEIAAAKLTVLTKNDPRFVGTTTERFELLGIEAKFFLSLLKEYPEDPVFIQARRWLPIFEKRLADARRDGVKKLDGYGLLDVSVMPFRLAPDGADLSIKDPMAPIETFLTKEKVVVAPPEAFDPKLEALLPSIDSLIQMLRADPVLGPRYQGIAPARGTPREQLISLARDEQIRRVLLEVVESDLEHRSAAERKRGAEVRDKIRYVDLLIVGLGLVNSNLENVFRQQGDLVTLGVDRRKIVASTFRNGGYAFFLNSTSRPEDRRALRQKFTVGTGTEARQLGGDLNFFPGGLLQINRFETRTNPVAISAALTIATNRAHSKGALQLETEAGEVKFIGDSLEGGFGRYFFEVKMSDGTIVRARGMVDTGIGVDDVPASVKGLPEAYAKAKAARVPGKPMRIMTMTDLYDWIDYSETPFDPFVDGAIGIAGPKDSGKAAVRWFGNLSDPRAYKLSSRSGGTVARLNWFGQQYGTCDLFLDNNRPYYSDIGRLYRSGRINAFAKMEQVTLRGDTVVVSTPGAQTISELSYLVLALGYKSLLPGMLKGYLGNRVREGENFVENPKIFRDVKGYEPSLGEVTYARQLLDPSGAPLPFFLIGPAAGRIIGRDELAQNEENSAANANHGWRTYRMGEAILQSFGPSIARSSTSSALPVVPTAPVAFRKDETAKFTLSLTPAREVRSPEPGDEMLLALRLHTGLSMLGSLAGQTITINITRGADTATERDFTISLTPAIDGAALEAFRKEFEQPRMRDLIFRLIGPSVASRRFELTMVYRADGTLDGEQSEFGVRRR